MPVPFPLIIPCLDALLQNLQMLFVRRTSHDTFHIGDGLYRDVWDGGLLTHGEGVWLTVTQTKTEETP